MTTLSEQQIDEALGESEWSREGQVILRELVFGDFREAIAFVNLLAEEAERANHHPDILIHGWNKVRLELFTHSEGGITQADLGMASAIDALL
jgi:4a-hydroxytetrahydrobiopterin dehydratase